jgi:uridine phosphorylase
MVRHLVVKVGERNVLQRIAQSIANDLRVAHNRA